MNVLVTGSSRGIGLSIAKKFAYLNNNVIMNCVNNTDKLNYEVNLLRKDNCNVIGIKADVSSYSDCKAMFDEIILRFGKNIDVLINNAGISHIGLFQDSTYEEFSGIIQNNLISVMNTTHLAVEEMIKNHSGSIINISSIWGETGASCEGAYSASKAGVNAFTKSMAKELGPSGIRVNAISCGVIDTDMNSGLTEAEREDLIAQIPMCRFGLGDEIADLCVFLASNNSSYITGQIIGVNGGMY